jgi:hypothetical protein
MRIWYAWREQHAEIAIKQRIGRRGTLPEKSNTREKKGQRDRGLYVGTNQAILYNFGTTSSLLNQSICKSSCRASEIIRLSPDLGCPADGGLEPRHRFFYRSHLQQQQCLLGLREPLQIPCDLCAGGPLCARSVASLDQCRHANCFRHRGQAFHCEKGRASACNGSFAPS